jgi:hypothetical protein
MQFNAPVFRRPPTVPERRYPAGVVVENTLRVWAISRWRGPVELARAFLTAGFAHLPLDAPVMFRLDEARDHTRAFLLFLTVTFTNRYDAYELLGKVFWCGCEFIAFTTFNIYTNFECHFPTRNMMHTLPYNFDEEEEEEEEEE